MIMSAIDLIAQQQAATIAKLQELIDSDPMAVIEALEKSRKQVAIDLVQAAKAPLIAFSNQESFEILDEQLPLRMVVHLAYSKLVAKEGKYTDKNGVEREKYTTKESHPKTYAFNDAIWETLRRIQAGKEAQGQKFDLSIDGLRDLLETLF